MFFSYIFIFAARIIDVSMATLRMLMIVRGRRIHAAILGFFEVIIYIVALGKVVSGLSDIRNLIAYALGFACGNFVGSFIEEKIAIGTLTAQIVCPTCDEKLLAEKLREHGFGVTIIEGEGREGKRYILNVILERKNIKDLYKLVDSMEQKPFVTIFDTKSVRGGYFGKLKRK